MDRFADEPTARELAARLADELVATGDITEPVWRDVFAAVPRHVFVPHFARTEQRPDGTRYELVSSTNPAQHDDWLRTVYSNTTLLTQVDGQQAETRFADGAGYGRHSSSSTKPGLMAWMLEALELDYGHCVLEIGTGSGYNAALLSERLGDGQVTTMDIDGQLTEAAAKRLAAVGYEPTVVTGDGRDGYPPRAPYDRVIPTCGLPYVPPAWIEQVRPGGRILTNLTGMVGGAMLLATVEHDGVAHGRFLPRWAGFMPSRHPKPADAGYSEDYTSGTTRLDPAVLTDPAFAFVAQLYLPHARRYWVTNDEGQELSGLIAHDGSWTEVYEPAPDGSRHIEQGGPRKLWSVVEGAYEFWQSNGRPDWTAFFFERCRGVR